VPHLTRRMDAAETSPPDTLVRAVAIAAAAAVATHLSADSNRDAF